MTTIIFGHPWHGSFNKAILDHVEKKLKQQGKPYQVIDLYKDGFNPALGEEDLALFGKGESNDPLVLRYQGMLQNTTRLIFIFPLWWYDTPAIIKGFLDKVMLKGFAYTESSKGLVGKLGYIQNSIVITTAQSPKWLLTLFGGNSIRRSFINAKLKSIGIKQVKWMHQGFVPQGSDEGRKRYLDKIYQAV